MNSNHVASSEANTVLVHSEIAPGSLTAWSISFSRLLNAFHLALCIACSFLNLLLDKDLEEPLGHKRASWCRGKEPGPSNILQVW